MYLRSGGNSVALLNIFYDKRLDVLSAEVREAGRSDHLPALAVITSSNR